MSRGGAGRGRPSRKAWRTEVVCDGCGLRQANGKATAALEQVGLGRHHRAKGSYLFFLARHWVSACRCGSTIATYAHP